ncbi:MAG TPA: hypothetical protein VFU97_03710, partial [Xanthobacteraceae bacterium]|nr:hypothetical protein [Xanthobacteraceae bacterium]
MGDDLTSTLTLSTDQTDYAPGSTATFTVDGVTAGDTYDFVVTDIYGNPVSGTNLPWDVVANADGTLTTTWAVGMDALGEAFQVTVVDETTGQIATASFTDGLHAPVQADVFVGTTDTGGTTVGNGLVFLTGDVNTSTGTGIFPSFVLIQNT